MLSSPDLTNATSRNERVIADLNAPFGTATLRVDDRTNASLGLLQEVIPHFEISNNVCKAGVLLALPALLSQGLLKSKDVYASLKKGYYGLTTIFLTLAFMMLSRIKNPEQLKQCKPGELGKALGIDRVPEVKCLRAKIEQLVSQNKTEQWGRTIAKEWMLEEDCFYFYIDGHVNIYSGDKANLAPKYKSQRKLCLAGTQEFWVNNQQGQPYLVFTGEVNEKLKDMISDTILPVLLEELKGRISEEELQRDSLLPRFTLLFDREAYEPAFFKTLWEKHRVAIISYRKNVKDKWEEQLFTSQETQVIGKDVTMSLAEKEVELDEMKMREIRKLCESGHQTSIVTTNFIIDTKTVAGSMFSRWSQENFFKYMMDNYDLDKMIEYGVEPAVQETRIVNPIYRKLTSKIKLKRDKKSRVEAKLYRLMDENFEANLNKQKKLLKKKAEIKEVIDAYEKDIALLLEERKKQEQHMTVKEMPQDKRYNKLKTESKLFINTIKMIAYRAETALTNLVSPFYLRAEEEGRMLIKEIINSDADIIPDYVNKTLTIKLHPLSTPRANKAAENLCELLTQTETIYPETDLKMKYEVLA